MHLKRFRGPSVRDALRRVRDELGADALVLSTAMVPVRGWRGAIGAREVEVTAAIERETPAIRPPQSAGRHPGPDGGAASVAAQLAATGLERALADEVVLSLPARHRRAPSPARLREALAARLAELGAVADAYARIEVFVGPPGAGKTTTIAKIAAQERARGGTRLGLVAADAYRIGAVEQLSTYAAILGAPFQVARTPRDLETILAGDHRVPVLVDTAGRPPSDPEARELFGVIRRAHDVRTHLVMSAGTPPAAARRIIDAYAEARPACLLLTKLDEAESLSPLVTLLRERRLPVSYLGTGQSVPDDLRRATAERLADSVLGDVTTAARIPS
jgi:flagellar biosynthesis protein FlhF